MPTNQLNVTNQVFDGTVCFFRQHVLLLLASSFLDPLLLLGRLLCQTIPTFGRFEG